MKAAEGEVRSSHLNDVLTFGNLPNHITQSLDQQRWIQLNGGFNRVSLMNPRHAIPLFLGAILVCAAAQQPGSKRPLPPVGKLSPGHDMNVARGSHTATLLPDFKVLIAGGTDDKRAVLASTEVYDPTTEQFTPAGRMTVPRQGHIAAVLSDGKVLIAGGANRSGALASSEDYEYDTRRFTPRGSMHTARVRASVTVLRDGSPLVVGGTNGVQPLDSSETYSVLTGKWTLVGKMSTPRVGHSATLLPDGRVLVVGGLGPKHRVLAAAEIFDPKTKQFTHAGELHQARFQHAAVLLANGKVLIVGGTSLEAKTSPALTSAELYDPASLTFTVTGSLNEGRSRLPDGASLLDGRALIAGGAMSAEVFDPRTAAFRQVDGTLDAVRFNCAAIQVMDGSVRIFGGNDDKGATRKSWIYRP